MKKFLRIIIWIVLAFVFLFLLLLFLMRPHTPKIQGQVDSSIQNIASLEKVTLGGYPQWICIRGHNIEAPLLLFLHGGPGMPMMYLSHTFQRPIEKKFVCIQWDRRGAGKSFSKNLSADTLNVGQLLSDTEELIHILRHRFGKKKVFIAGHSFGSYLGMIFARMHPELVAAYIGIGQVTDSKRARGIQDRFIRNKAESLGVQEAVADLKAYGTAVHEKWLFRFGGELYASTSFMPFIKAGFLSPEYGLFDIPKVSQGSSFSSRHMKYNIIDGALIDNVKELRVPVYFFMGCHDYVTPIELVREYYTLLKAPQKGMVWFENSSHFPFFEEPDVFAAEMIRILKEFQNTPPGIYG